MRVMTLRINLILYMFYLNVILILHVALVNSYGVWSASLLVCRCLYTTRSSQLAPTAKKKKKDHQPPNLSTNHAGSHLAVVGFCHLSNPYNHIIIFYLFIFFNAGMRTVVALVVSDGTRVPVKPLYTLTPFHSAKKNFVWNFSDFILF